MLTYISLLRGINVSGQKKILMADLKLLYESIGLSNVQTYIQSGNVVFQSAENDRNSIASAIQNAIQAKYNFDVKILILTPTDFETAINNNPYAEIEDFDTKHLYAIFLFSEIDNMERFDGIEKFKQENEYYKLIGNVIYLYCKSGYGNSKLSNNLFENKLKVTATARNWNSTLALHKISLNLST